MSKIYNVSAGFLQICENYLGKKDISPQKIFQELSFAMGGDGKTISKKQLDSYIKKADNGTIKVDSNRLKALKRIQKNWDKISKGKDSISFDDMQGFESLLIATVMGSFVITETNSEEKITLKNDIYDYLKKSLNISDKSDIKKEDLANYLNDVLSESEDDDINNEIIGTLVNLISSYNQTSTEEYEV